MNKRTAHLMVCLVCRIAAESDVRVDIHTVEEFLRLKCNCRNACSCATPECRPPSCFYPARDRRATFFILRADTCAHAYACAKR